MSQIKQPKTVGGAAAKGTGVASATAHLWACVGKVFKLSQLKLTNNRSVQLAKNRKTYVDLTLRGNTVYDSRFGFSCCSRL